MYPERNDRPEKFLHQGRIAAGLDVRQSALLREVNSRTGHKVHDWLRCSCCRSDQIGCRIRQSHVDEQPLCRNQFFFAASFFSRANHDRGAVGIISTNVNAAIANQLLKTNPNIRLDVFDQVTDVDRSVGVGQGAGDQDLACHRKGLVIPLNENVMVRRWIVATIGFADDVTV